MEVALNLLKQGYIKKEDLPYTASVIEKLEINKENMDRLKKLAKDSKSCKSYNELLDMYINSHKEQFF